ncbi:MAG: TatD family hydrolase [Gammaproteobacteria bacterium]|nr:TatD family hydrolase [Gammaproteobacteria bacterium]
MFDSHCHLDFAEFDADREAVLADCRRLGVEGMLVPGVTAATWPRLLALTDAHPDVFPALGLHPMFIDEHRDAHLAELENLLQAGRAVAVGEIGLDFFLPQLDRQRQQYFFVEQLKLAQHYHLPLILHVRKAHDQVLAQLRRMTLVGGIVHAFGGSEQQAYQYIELGFKLGFGGAMTWPRAKKLQHLVATLPLESLLLETDAPDMPPVWAAGQRSSPQYLPQYARFIAQLRGVDESLIRRQTTETARRALGLA